MKKRVFLGFLILFFFAFTTDVNAEYIDPSVMTYAIQAIAGIVIALSTFFRTVSFENPKKDERDAEMGSV